MDQSHPRFTVAQARAYLLQLTAPYVLYRRFRGRYALDCRYGPLVLAVVRTYRKSGVLSRVVVVSVWPGQAVRQWPARRRSA